MNSLAADVICVLFYCTCAFEILNIHHNNIVEENVMHMHVHNISTLSLNTLSSEKEGKRAFCIFVSMLILSMATKTIKKCLHS